MVGPSAPTSTLSTRGSLTLLMAAATAKDAGKAADVFVHENPWKAIGIAAGIGLVFGLLISRR